MNKKFEFVIRKIAEKMFPFPGYYYALSGMPFL